MRKMNVPDEVEYSQIPALTLGMTEVRTFAWGRVVAGEWEGSLVLIVQEFWDVADRNTFYKCEDAREMEREIDRVRWFGVGGGGGGGAAGSGVPSPIEPVPPTRSAGEARALPRDI